MPFSSLINPGRMRTLNSRSSKNSEAEKLPGRKRNFKISAYADDPDLTTAEYSEEDVWEIENF